MRFRSLKYASSFFSKNENDVNLVVTSTVYLQTFIIPIALLYLKRQNIKCESSTVLKQHQIEEV